MARGVCEVPYGLATPRWRGLRRTVISTKHFGCEKLGGNGVSRVPYGLAIAGWRGLWRAVIATKNVGCK